MVTSRSRDNTKPPGSGLGSVSMALISGMLRVTTPLAAESRLELSISDSPSRVGRARPVALCTRWNSLSVGETMSIQQASCSASSDGASVRRSSSRSRVKAVSM